MRIRGDSAFALAFIAIGFAPALIKKSKPLARYLGDQLIRVGEYLQHDTEESSSTPTAETITAPPVVDPVEPVEATFAPENAEEDPIGAAYVEAEAISDSAEPTDPEVSSVTDEKFEDESQKSWD